MQINPELMSKCGFYCGSCPSLANNKCKGCVLEHKTGDCFTRDCVINKKLNFCTECDIFPCETIITKPHCTILDKAWLIWKSTENDN